MTRRSLYFVAPGEVELREEPLPEPGADQLRIRTEISAISPGTELLVYNGDVPSDLAADANLDSLSGSLSYPLKYGYAAVGIVETVGTEVDDAWLDRRVFAFNPHESHFCATVDELYPVPEGVDSEAAALLPTVETAVTFVHDGAPKLGERVVVFGQGPIGLLTTALLGSFPLERLITVDYSPYRRERSERLGATHSVHPESITGALPLPGDDPTAAHDGADLTYELSGNPDALDAAVSATGYDGRIVIGSWYGTKPTELDLGGRFHRSRISLTSSQVSTIDPALRGRWDRERRMDRAWSLLADREFERLLTDRYRIDDAPVAYARLADGGDGDDGADEMLGTLFSYDGSL